MIPLKITRLSIVQLSTNFCDLSQLFLRCVHFLIYFFSKNSIKNCIICKGCFHELLERVTVLEELFYQKLQKLLCPNWISSVSYVMSRSTNLLFKPFLLPGRKCISNSFFAVMKIKYLFHARMREILSYPHIPKTTTMCSMYEANYSD